MLRCKKCGSDKIQYYESIRVKYNTNNRGKILTHTKQMINHNPESITCFACGSEDADTGYKLNLEHWQIVPINTPGQN